MFDTVNVGLWRQLFAGVSASMGSFCAAALFAWVTPILPQLLSANSEIPMTPQEASWMIASPEFANMVTPLPAGLLADRLGRRPVMLMSAPLFAVGWVIILYYRSLTSLIVARSFQGAAVGIVYTVIPVYLGEIASKESRGAITSLFFTFYWLGLLFEYCTGPFMSFTNYTGATLITTLVFFAMCWFQPESPHFLLLKGKKDEALKSLKWFRASSEEVVGKEFDNILQFAEKENIRETTFKDVISTPTDRKALYMILFAGSLRVCSGTFSIVAYATGNFNSIYNLNIESKYITILFGIVLVLGACFSFFTLDVFGRRPLIIGSSLGSSISLIIVGAVYFLQTETEVDVSRWSWLAPVATMVYAAVVVAGLNPVNTAYTSELFASTTRSTASSIATVLSTLLTLVTVKLYQDFIDLFGVYFNFFLFGGLCMLGAILSFLYMPETKNKTFEQIRQELSVA